MLPHQIYCDYLEDKGIDTRLLRTQEVSWLIMSSGAEDLYYRERDLYNPTGKKPRNTLRNGDGFSEGYSWNRGDGFGYGRIGWIDGDGASRSFS